MVNKTRREASSKTAVIDALSPREWREMSSYSYIVPTLRDAERKGLPQVEKSILEAVELATVASQDWLTFFMVADTFIQMASRKRSSQQSEITHAYLQGIQALNAYCERTTILQRAFFVSTTRLDFFSQVSMQLLYRIDQSFTANPEVFSPELPHRFLWGTVKDIVKTTQDKKIEGSNTPLLTAVPAKPIYEMKKQMSGGKSSRELEGIEKEREVYDLVRLELINLDQNDVLPTDQMVETDKILTILYESPSSAEYIRGPLDGKAGNSTLRELFARPFSSDEDGFRWLEHLSTTPADFFWDRLKSAVFLFPPYFAEAMNPGDTHELFQKIYTFQVWMAKKLLLPVYTDAMPDPQFDQLFVRFVSKLQVPTIHKLIQTVTAITYKEFPNHQTVFAPGASPEESLADCPFTASCIPDLHPLAIQTGRFSTAVRSGDILRQGVSAMTKRILAVGQEVTTENHSLIPMRRVQAFAQRFEQYAQENMAQRAGRIFMDVLKKEKLGTTFLSAIENHVQVLSQKATELQSAQPGREIENWPRSDVINTVKFSANSLPKMMGLEEVQFFVYDDPTRPIYFFMKTNITHEPLVGHLSKEGVLVESSIDFSQESPMMERLFQLILQVTWKDLVTREYNRKEGLAKPAVVTPVESTPNDLGEEQASQQKNPISLARRSSSRRPQVFEEVTSSDQLITQVEKSQKKRGAALYQRIGAYRRKVGYADLYVGLNELYREMESLISNKIILGQEVTPSEYQELEERRDTLQEARKMLRKTSHDKIADLPPQFVIQFVTDADATLDPEESEFAMHTWVQQHYNPSIPEGTSLEDIVEKVYAPSSMLASLELIVSAGMQSYDLTDQAVS